jgi:hypothetical protein
VKLTSLLTRRDHVDSFPKSLCYKAAQQRFKTLSRLLEKTQRLMVERQSQEGLSCNVDLAERLVGKLFELLSVACSDLPWVKKSPYNE